jgi:HK97 family phage major capsid protein
VKNEKLQRAIEARKAAFDAMDAAATAYEAAEGDDLEARKAEFEEARTAFNAAKAEVERIEEIEEARAANPGPGDPVEPEKDKRIKVTEPVTYARENQSDSWLLDVARVGVQHGDVEGARERLSKHRVDIKDYVEARERRAEREFDDEMGRLVERLPVRLQRVIEEHGLAEKRAVSRIDGSAGEFVPPVWLLEEYAGLARAGRPFANEVRQIPLPPKTDSVNIPRITTGSLTGSQQQDNQAVTSQDLASAAVQAPVRTIAGQVDIAMQLLDQSPISYDELVFADLIADYGMQLDIQCLNGSGINGQLLGILNVSSINSVTYTDGTPTVPELYPKLADALNQAAANRKIVPSHYWWASRRWFWAAKEVDSQSRPFFVSLAGSQAMNAYGSFDEQMLEGGPVTNVIGVPVYLDNNMPTNLGGGSNEDRVIATRMRDHVLLEGDIRARALKEILSGTLGVRLQVYAYVAFTAGRFPAATSVVSGTGLATPTF